MRQKGFSLVELMIGLTILVAVMSFGIPGFKTSVANSQIRTVAESIKYGLQLARAEAIKRNTKVEFTLNANSAWQVGCQTVVAGDCPAVIQSKNKNEGASGNIALTITSGSKVIFNSFGLRDSASTITQVDIKNSHLTPDQQTELRVVISGGNAKVCDPAVTTVGDPRTC